MNVYNWNRLAWACAFATTLLWQTIAFAEDSDARTERAMTLEDIANWPGSPESGAVSDDGRWFAFIQPSSKDSQVGTLQVRRIGADDVASIENVATYALSGGEDPMLVTHHIDNSLVIRNLSTRNVAREIEDVQEYAFDSDRRMLAVISGAKYRLYLQVLDIRQPTNIKRLLSDARELKAPGWSPDGRALTVYQTQASSNDARGTRLLHVFRKPLSAKPTHEAIELAQLASNMSDMQWRADAPPQWLADGSGIVLNAQAAPEKTEERHPKAPWVVVWHWKSAANHWLESARRAYGYVATDTLLVRFADRAVIALARGEFEKAIVPSRAKHWGLVLDRAPYARLAGMTGNEKVDVYAVDLRNGKRRLLLPDVKDHHFAREVWPSPDGERLLYWRDRNYHVYELATGRSRNLTASVPVSFLDRLDDRGREEPPIPAIGVRGDGNALSWGWSRDSAHIVLHDGKDLWRFAAANGKAINLTSSQEALGAEWYERLPLVSSESASGRNEGLDLSRPIYVAPFNRHTKRSGIARIDVLRGKVEVLKWDDGIFADWRSPMLLKAKNADVYVYRYERADQARGFYATDASFKRATRLDGGEVDRFRTGIAWSPGSMVLEYTADNGRPLFATLYLPAGYEQGKAYPTIVEVYEQTSDGRNAFSTPDDFVASRSFYTSNGYAVLRPDLTYKMNDPFLSAARYTQQALQKAIATGVVDARRVGLIGTSFGGYETNFIVTQTDAFRAAVASAGGGNMFRYYMPRPFGEPESSISDHNQHRMRGPLTAANADSFIRNSAILYADRVTTPLLLINNTHDNAVHWEEGLEMFNALRRHDKPVILLQYPEEGHTPPYANPANGRDRAERVKQFFDHHLKGAPAPAWIQEGVQRQHLPNYLATPK